MRVRMEDLIRTVREAAPLFRDKERAAKIQVKGAADFVTQVDFQVQEYVKARLEALEPEIQFMGEEKDNGAIDFSRPAWILDPVDGTTNLIHDFRASVISLALWQDGDVRMGVVYQPYTDEMFTAVRGGGAFLNGEPIRVSSAAHLREALISIGTSPYHKELADENFRRFTEVFKRCGDIRRIGSAALELAYTACGRLDGFFERGLNPWDFAAGVLLVEEAGGQVTDFSGNPVDITQAGDILASNGRIGGQIREAL
ncbi:MAG TPA: inositol monophosphatase [Candidatus Enterocloster excrementipullorum]|uniref:Inositol-1-monophosphatase n=1 Tax=Candidatus Enterocloster excrementipullorum TaxID=2838559 RepID=A0A9D2MYR2_9FIRM|nr:inositol monophosphatase [Candidatus Enterocloster excrementipullorum]